MDYVACWPISEVADHLEVRFVGGSGLVLLRPSSSHFDPKRTSAFERFGEEPFKLVPTNAVLPYSLGPIGNTRVSLL